MSKKLFSKLIISFIALALSVAVALPAFAAEKRAVSASLSLDGVKALVPLGEKPQLKSGYADFKFEDGGSERVYLNDERLPAFPSTAERGRINYSFELYGWTLSAQFIAYDPTASAKQFTDVPHRYWGYEKIRNVFSAGFMNGMSKTSFAPKASITRAQFCQTVYNIYKNDPSVMDYVEDTAFSDVPVGKWYYEAVSACAAAGIVNGVEEGVFDPDAHIKRQDAALIMMRILTGGEPDVDVEKTLAEARKSGIAAGDFDEAGEYAKKALAASLGVIFFGDEHGDLHPKDDIKRAECASLISNLFFGDFTLEKEKFGVVYLSPENRKNEYTGVKANESDEMYKVANLMKPMLEKLGYTVYIADRSLSIREEGNNRALEAAELGADVYVALHTNATGRGNNGSAHGTICFYNGQNEGAKELSQFIYAALSELMPWNDRGIHDDILESRLNGQKPYAEVKRPTMANLICEVEFHDYNASDGNGGAIWITKNTENIAKAITKGIDDYFEWKNNA